MSEYRIGLVFRQLALVPFLDSWDFGRFLKSYLENPEPNKVYSYKSIWTGGVWLNDQKVVYIRIPFHSDFSLVWIWVVRYSDIHCKLFIPIMPIISICKVKINSDFWHQIMGVE